MASKMTFHESYGDLPVFLLRAIRKHNVSPSDYDALVQQHGTDYSTIAEEIKVFSSTGSFNVYRWAQDCGAMF